MADIKINDCRQLQRLYNAVKGSDGIPSSISDKDCQNLQKASEKFPNDTNRIISFLEDLGRVNRQRLLQASKQNKSAVKRPPVKHPGNKLPGYNEGSFDERYKPAK